MDVKVKNNLGRIESQIEKALSQAVRTAAHNIWVQAKLLAPVDHGFLRNSIEVNVESPLKATIGTNIEYAKYQEFGTRYQKGKAFLTPAFDVEEKKFQSELQKIERSLR
jgi:HK97 gp10 family phage protein